MTFIKKHYFPATVFLAGVLVTLIISFILYNVSLRRLEAEKRFFEETFKSKLQNSWRLEKLNLFSLANFYQSTGFVSQDEFLTLSEHTLKQSHMINAISWWQLVFKHRKKNLDSYITMVYQYPAQSKFIFNKKSNYQAKKMFRNFLSSKENLPDGFKVYDIHLNKNTKEIIAYVFVPIRDEQNKLFGFLLCQINISRFVKKVYIHYKPYGIDYQLYIGSKQSDFNSDEKLETVQSIISNKVGIILSDQRSFTTVEWISILSVFLIGSLFSIILSIFIGLNMRKYKRIREITREKAESFDEEVRKRSLIQKRLEVYQNFLEKLVSERTNELKKTNEYLTANQNKLIESEKMASLGLMAAGIAHEINNPMAFIKSNNQSLMELLIPVKALLEYVDEYFEMSKSSSQNEEKLKSLSSKILEILDKISLKDLRQEVAEILLETADGIERIQDIISSLRTFLHQGDGVMTKENIKHIIERSIKVASVSYKERSIKIIRKYEFNGEVECYPNRLSQVIINILNNSADSFLCEKKNCIEITVKADSNILSVIIEDNGEGMDENAIKNIFTPFYTTKEVGSGLGLGMYVSYTIIKRHHGNIEVKSEKGKGTIFIIEIPIIQGKEYEANSNIG